MEYDVDDFRHNFVYSPTPENLSNKLFIVKRCVKPLKFPKNISSNEIAVGTYTIIIHIQNRVMCFINNTGCIHIIDDYPLHIYILTPVWEIIAIYSTALCTKVILL